MILSAISEEEKRFNKTLEKGMKEFETISQKGDISGKDAFVLFSTYGFPLEMTIEMAKEKNIKVDVSGFNKEFEKHQHLSKSASTGMFKGGLADAGEKNDSISHGDTPFASGFKNNARRKSGAKRQQYHN